MMNARRAPLTLAGQRIRRGETRDVFLRFSESYLGVPVTIPIRVIRSRQAGPRVFVTGAIHGDELNGAGIIRQLLFENSLEIQRGTLICVPVVNIYGLEHHSRYLPDRRDLNRCFPGSTTGSLSSRLAHALFHEVIRKCDYGLDFHSAAVHRTNYPNVRADLRSPGVRTLAQAFGCELIVNSTGPEGSLRRAAVAAGVPTIILEAGEVWKIEPSVVETGVRGVLNVLYALRMLDGKQEPPLFQVKVSRTTWVRAERGGFLGFHAAPGAVVQRGQVLATNFHIFGRERNQLLAPVAGIVLGVTTMPAVKPGEPVYHVAALAKRTMNRVERALNQQHDNDPFFRVRQDLATNIHVHKREDL